MYSLLLAPKRNRSRRISSTLGSSALLSALSVLAAMMTPNIAEEISKGRDVPYFAKEDFAYIRLKIYLKVQLNAEDEMIFEAAQKFIKSSPFVDDEGKLHSAKFYQSKMRKDVL